MLLGRADERHSSELRSRTRIAKGVCITVVMTDGCWKWELGRPRNGSQQANMICFLYLP